jgi:dCMP deaminase
VKRSDYISWDDFFMAIALISAMRSKDPNTQVGTCIVGKDNRVIGVGYNGFPDGCSDDNLPWNRDGEFLNTKYPYVCHAESNAIHNSQGKLKDAILYSTLFPCHNCAKDIIQAGIRRIYYLEDKYYGTDSNIAARKMFELTGVECKLFTSDLNSLVINFTQEKKK